MRYTSVLLGVLLVLAACTVPETSDTTAADISEDSVDVTPVEDTPITQESSTPVSDVTEPEGYTLEEVALHPDEKSCWTAIDGEVYDLTPWIDRHPGGARNILKLCGVDGTLAFQNRHGSSARANTVLEGFFIGPLV